MSLKLDKVCDKCNQPLEMYYKPWCPHCEKPQRQSRETLDLIPALEHIEAITGDKGHPMPGYPQSSMLINGYKDRMWDWMIWREVVRSNDSYTAFIRPDDTDVIAWQYDFQNDQQRQDVKLFCDTFDIDDTNGVLLDISW